MTTRTLLPALIVAAAFHLLPAASPPELIILQQVYDKSVAERVTVPFETALTALNAKFTTALDKAVGDAQQTGKLDDVLTIQGDKQRLADKLPLPDDDDKTPAALKKLRAIYHDQLKKLEDARSASHSPLIPPYSAKLQTLEVTLTKAGRFDEAKEIKTYREGLASATPGTPAATGSKPTASTTATPPKTGSSRMFVYFWFFVKKLGKERIGCSGRDGKQEIV